MVCVTKHVMPRIHPLFSRGYSIESDTNREMDVKVIADLIHDASASITLSRKGGWSTPICLRIALQHNDLETTIDAQSQDVKLFIVKFPCSLGRQGIGAQKIPRKLYQTFTSADVSPRMKCVVDSWQQLNPEYDVHFYDDRDAREWMVQNMEADVVYAYDRLIPGAFRADLWRYCILYREGGVYADIAMESTYPLRDFIAADAGFVVPRDRPSHCSLLYNAFIAATPQHPILKEAISRVVHHVQAEWYGKESLGITGPIVLGQAANHILGRPSNTEFELGIIETESHSPIHILEHIPGMITYKGTMCVRTKYPGYGEDRTALAGPHYGTLFQQECVYKKKVVDREETTTQKGSSRIPRVIYQTFRDRLVTPGMHKATETWKHQNPEYQYRFYTEDTMRSSLEPHFSNRVLSALDRLIPGAYRADLWRYCILYIHGGVYADVDMSCIVPLRHWIRSSTRGVFVRDGPSPDLYNAFIAIEPKHPVLLRAIHTIVEHVHADYYGIRDTDVTGPGVLGEAYRTTLLLDKGSRPSTGLVRKWSHLILLHQISQQQIQLGDEIVLHTKYAEYDRDRLLLGGEDWAAAWKARRVYKEQEGSS